MRGASKMKGVALAVLIVLLLACCDIALANSPIVPPVQYEQFCEANKVVGTGVIDSSIKIIDKKIALKYYDTMAGDGDLELNQENAYSQNADKLKRNITSVDGGNESNLNLFKRAKMTYSGKTPLLGEKYLVGIGAKIQEKFAVNEMEKEETSFYASTTPYNPAVPCDQATMFCQGQYPEKYLQYLQEYYPQLVPSTITPKNLVKALKMAGRDDSKVAELMGNDPARVIGIETKNSFNGTWGTDAKWHKIFYRDIKDHEMFTGKFEAEKTIKFHENPVP
jgi:hypothetical protein